MIERVNTSRQSAATRKAASPGVARDTTDKAATGNDITLEVTPDVFADASFQKSLRDLSATARVKVSVRPAEAPPAPAPALPTVVAAPLPAPVALAVPGSPNPVGMVYLGLVMPPPGHVSPTPGLALIGLVPWTPQPAEQPQAPVAMPQTTTPQPQAPVAQPTPAAPQPPVEVNNPYATASEPTAAPSPAAPPAAQNPATPDDASSLTPFQKAGCAMMLGLSLASGILGGVIGASTRPPAPPQSSVSCPVETGKPQTEKAGAPAQTEAAKPAQTEAAKPAQTEAAKPAQTEAAKPAQTEAAKPAQTEAAKPAQTETPKAAKKPAGKASHAKPQSHGTQQEGKTHRHTPRPRPTFPAPQRPSASDELDQPTLPPTAPPATEQPATSSAGQPATETPASKPATETPAAQPAAQTPAAPTSDTPITSIVNGHVRNNHLGDKYLLAGEQNLSATSPAQNGLQGAAAVTGGVAAVETVTALSTAHSAIALGAQAHALGAQATALGAQAASLQAAAQAAAQAGQLQQAAALAAQAKAAGAQAMSMGSTAKGMGAQAMALGDKAKSAAAIAKPAMIASGAIAMIDGGIDIYQGHKVVETANELNHLARTTMQQEINANRDTERVWDDYVNVHYQLHDMKAEAQVREGVGGVKAASGALMAASPFTGPAAPVVGAIGGIGYLGASIFGHAHKPHQTQPLIVHPAEAQSLTQYANGGGNQ